MPNTILHLDDTNVVLNKVNKRPITIQLVIIKYFCNHYYQTLDWASISGGMQLLCSTKSCF